VCARDVWGAVRQSRRHGVSGSDVTHGAQIVGPELVDLDAHRWFAKRLLEERCGLRAVEPPTGMTPAGLVDECVGVVGLVDHDGIDRRYVVGAQQPEPCRVGERLVEQSLVMAPLE
jgi:hypothetical protein